MRKIIMRETSPFSPTRPVRVLFTVAIVLLAVFAATQLFDFAYRVHAISSNVVISEFRVRGPNGAADEFVELYNLSGAPVAIGGWKIRGSNNAAGVADRATITAGTILQAGCH